MPLCCVPKHHSLKAKSDYSKAIQSATAILLIMVNFEVEILYSKDIAYHILTPWEYIPIVDQFNRKLKTFVSTFSLKALIDDPDSAIP